MRHFGPDEYFRLIVSDARSTNTTIQQQLFHKLKHSITEANLAASKHWAAITWTLLYTMMNHFSMFSFYWEVSYLGRGESIDI